MGGSTMHIVIKNDIEITNPNTAVVKWVAEHLIINNPDFLIAQKLGRYTAHMEQKLKLFTRDVNVITLPFGCLKSVFALRDKVNDTYVVQISPFKGNKLTGSINLYDYQQNAVARLLEAKNGVLVAPCGSGKTQMGLELIKRVGGKALWLTHTKKLLTQSKERCESNFSGDFGTITEGKVSIGRDITFATVQTLSKVDPRVYQKAFDIVVVDEAHHCTGSPTKVKMFYKVLSNINCRYKYGLTATPKKGELGETMFYILGDKVCGISEEMVGDKIIKAKHVPVFIDIKYEHDKYLSGDGMLDFGALVSMLSGNTQRNELIAKQVMANTHFKQLILCHRVAQVKALCELIGSGAVAIYGAISAKKRNFETSNIIVATYALAKEGLDIPSLSVLHLATPIKERGMVRQCVGRVERNVIGKSEPLVYDYVDTEIAYCMGCYTKRKNILK